MRPKNALLALLTLCLITFTATAQRGGGHGGGGGGHVSAGGGGMRSGGGFSAPAVHGGGGGFVGGSRLGGGVAAGRVIGVVGGGRVAVGPRAYGYRSPYYRGIGRGFGLGFYGGYYAGYPGYYGCPYASPYYADPYCYPATPYVSYGYSQPVAVDPGPDYYPQQYAAPQSMPQPVYAAPPPRQAPVQPEQVKASLTLLSFKDHSVRIASAYSLDRGFLVYVDENGMRNSVPADQLDFDATRELNAKRGMTFSPR
jgi:hypothetical protein